MSVSQLVPACGGTERPFQVRGVWWLYCWDQGRELHCYRNLDTGELVYNRSFHPSFSPQFTDNYDAARHQALCFF